MLKEQAIVDTCGLPTMAVAGSVQGVGRHHSLRTSSSKELRDLINIGLSSHF